MPVERIETLAEADKHLNGIVVTHGTASLEETAYFLNLTLHVDLPVVIVGSQRPASALSTDAGMNLVNAEASPGRRENRWSMTLSLLVIVFLPSRRSGWLVSPW
jgi:L-asparaginase